MLFSTCFNRLIVHSCTSPGHRTSAPEHIVFVIEYKSVLLHFVRKTRGGGVQKSKIAVRILGTAPSVQKCDVSSDKLMKNRKISSKVGNVSQSVVCHITGSTSALRFEYRFFCIFSIENYNFWM